MLTGRGHSWRGFPSFYGVRALLPPPYRHSLPWGLVAPSTIPPGKTEKRKKSILRLCCGKGCRNRSSPTRSPLPLATQNRRYKPFALVKKSAEEVVLMLDPRSFPSKKESELFKKEKDDNLYL